MEKTPATEEMAQKVLVSEWTCADNAMLDYVMENIFTKCDQTGKGVVETTELLQYIEPFLKSDDTAASELKKSLDPSNSNPMINMETFHIRMSQWYVKMSGADPEDSLNITPRDFQRLDEGDVPFVQSTPKSNFGHHLLKGYVDAGIMNVSSCLVYNPNESVTSKGPDRAALEEHIQELEHQKKRTAEELSRVRAELASSLEANDGLQGKVDKALKRLSNEQKLNEQLQNERRREEDDEVEQANAKQIATLKKAASTMEKQIGELNAELEEVRTENRVLEEKKEKIVKKHEEAAEAIISLETEVEVWKQNAAEAREVYAALDEENRKLHDVIEQCSCEIDKLKFQQATLEKFLKTTTGRDSSFFFPHFTRSNSPGTYSPILQNFLTKHLLNTPNTRSKIINPVSPLGESPFVPLSQSTPIEILSPPTVYVIEKTDPHIEETTSNESDSFEDLPTKIRFMATASDSNENLQEEMSKVPSEEFLSFSEATKLLKDYQLKMLQLANEALDLKTQLSLNYDKKTMLLERNRSLEETVASNVLHINEISAKLAENGDLEAKCRDVEAKLALLEIDNSVKYMKIVDLTFEVDRLRGGSTKVEEKKESSQEILRELKEEIEHQRVKLQSVEEDRVSLKIEVGTLVAKIMKLEETNRDLERDHRKQLSHKEEELKNVKSEKNALNTQLKEYETKLEEYRNSLEQSRNESAIFKNHNHALEKEHETLKEKQAELSRRLENNRNQYDILRVTHEISEQNRKELDEKCAKDLETYRAELSKLERENEALRSENFNLKSNVNTLDGELFQLKEKISLYHAEKHDSDEIKYNLIREKRDLSIRLENQNKTIEELKETNEDLNVLVREKDDLISELNADLISLKKTSEELEEKASEVEALKETTLGLNEKFETTKKKLDEERKTKLEYMSKLDDSQKENLNLLKIIRNLEKEIESLKEGASKLRDRTDALTFENKTLKDLLEHPEHLLRRLKEMSEENEMLREECKKIFSEEKAKMIEQTNKSFSDALQRMYTAEREFSKTDEDFTEYCKKEIEKYKMENEKFKNEIATLTSKALSIDDCERSQSKKTNFDKLTIKNEKLEMKVEDLQKELLHKRRSLGKVASQRDAINNELEALKAKNESRLEELHQLKESLLQGRSKLEGFTLSVATYFRVAENFSMLVVEPTTPSIAPDLFYMKDEICRMRQQIDVTSTVLNHLITMKMAFNQVGSQTENSGDAGTSRDLGAVEDGEENREDEQNTEDNENEQVGDLEAGPILNESVLEDLGSSELGDFSDEVPTETTLPNQAVLLIAELESCKKLLLDVYGRLRALVELLESPRQEHLVIRLMTREATRLIHCLEDVRKRLKSIERSPEDQSHLDEQLQLPDFQNTARSSTMGTLFSPRPFSRTKKIITTCFSLWIIFVALCCMFILSVFNDDSVYLPSPWSLKTLDGPWCAFIEKKYVGTPPT